MQGGLGAVLDSGDSQVLIEKPCENDHGVFRMVNKRNRLEQDLEARHVRQINFKHNAVD